MKKYLVFDLDGTLIESQKELNEIIINYLKDNFGVEKDKVSYYLSTTRGTGLPVQIQKILEIDKKKAKDIAKEIYEEINSSTEGFFFNGVLDKIKELKENYKIFLSTGNSTKFAEDNLKRGKIYDYFEYVLGSEETPKSSEHIKIFKENIGDENFEMNSIFIGDGEMDRFIAKENNMVFIHIDKNLENTHGDKYEIKSVAEIDNILNNLK